MGTARKSALCPSLGFQSIEIHSVSNSQNQSVRIAVQRCEWSEVRIVLRTAGGRNPLSPRHWNALMGFAIAQPILRAHRFLLVLGRQFGYIAHRETHGSNVRKYLVGLNRLLHQ